MMSRWQLVGRHIVLFSPPWKHCPLLTSSETLSSSHFLRNIVLFSLPWKHCPLLTSLETLFTPHAPPQTGVIWLSGHSVPEAEAVKSKHRDEVMCPSHVINLCLLFLTKLFCYYRKKTRDFKNDWVSSNEFN